MVLFRQYRNQRLMWHCAILKCTTAPMSKLILRKSTCPPYCRSFSWFYEFIPIWRTSTISVIILLRGACCKFQYWFFVKMQKNFCRTKKLVLSSICKLSIYIKVQGCTWHFANCALTLWKALIGLKRAFDWCIAIPTLDFVRHSL